LRSNSTSRTKKSFPPASEINDLKKDSDISQHGEHRDYGWRGCVERHGFYRWKLSGEGAWRGDKAALEEKKRHDKALEAYQAAYAKYTRDRTQLLDWIATNAQIKAEAKQNFTNTDYAFKLYNQALPDERMIPPKEPKFSDFYQPSEQHKNGELMFVGAGAPALGYAAFRFL